MTDHVALASELFRKGCNCCQAVFCAFCDETRFDFETAMKLASSFGGGMGRMREVCGACSGMFMTVGCLYGYSVPGDDESKKAHYAAVQDLAAQFKERNGTIICRELLKALGVNSLPVPTVRDDSYYKVRPCCRFVEDAARITEAYINSKK